MTAETNVNSSTLRRTLATICVFMLSTGGFAEFTGLTYSVLPTQPFGSDSVVLRLYASFSSLDDRVIGVHCASADSTLPFYQNPFGSWTEPNPALLAVFPELQWDTFLTIGLTAQQPRVGGTMLTPDSQFGPETFLAGWLASSDKAFTHGPEVLLGQFTFDNVPPDLVFVELSIGVEWIDLQGKTHLSCDSMYLGPVLTPLSCYAPDRADSNHDCTVDGLDLAMLLGAWGTATPATCWVPFTACLGDLSCDGLVNGMDLALLLGEWGTVPGCPWQR